jgi:hypothetical protein
MSAAAAPTVVWPSETDMAVLPRGTQPPEWVTDVDMCEYDRDGSRGGWWRAPVECWSAPVAVEQFIVELDGKRTLSEPYIDIDVEQFELSPKEARELSRALVRAAKLLERATRETWELLGAAGSA